MPDDIPVLSVTELTGLVKEVLESSFPLVAMLGEISNFRQASSGHLYFTLKDETSQVSAVMWRSAASRLKFCVEDGLEVIAAGPLELYQNRGTFQVIVKELIPQGVGPLELAFRQLQAKLSAEGLFDPERKRPLPTFPRRIALITSPSSAAVRDMLQILTRRWPVADVVIIPVLVQGEGAAEQIAEALGFVHRLPRVDVVITGRGGGSLEDLWAFNEEIVARAIAACPLPVVSAVGHEIDVTIADLVADKRALTPSEAAELVVPDQREIRGQLESVRDFLVASLRELVQDARREVDHLASRRVLTHPRERLHDQTQRVDELSDRLRRALQQRCQLEHETVRRLAETLEALSPLAVLSRGYSLTSRLPSGELLRSVQDIRPGERLQTRLADGTMTSRVESVDPFSPPAAASE